MKVFMLMLHQLNKVQLLGKTKILLPKIIDKIKTNAVSAYAILCIYSKKPVCAFDSTGTICL